MLTTRQPRYHAPLVAEVATGPATSANSALSGAGPSRARARVNDPVVGTCHEVRQRRAHASPPTSSRATSS